MRLPGFRKRLKGAFRFKPNPINHMKTKFLFAGLALALSFGALAPTSARADHERSGYYVTRIVGYDRCGRPVYERCWVPVCNPRPVCPDYGYGRGYQSYPSYGGYGYGSGFSFSFGGFGAGYVSRHHCR